MAPPTGGEPPTLIKTATLGHLNLGKSKNVQLRDHLPRSSVVFTRKRAPVDFPSAAPLGFGVEIFLCFRDQVRRDIARGSIGGPSSGDVRPRILRNGSRDAVVGSVGVRTVTTKKRELEERFLFFSKNRYLHCMDTIDDDDDDDDYYVTSAGAPRWRGRRSTREISSEPLSSHVGYFRGWRTAPAEPTRGGAVVLMARTKK